MNVFPPPSLLFILVLLSNEAIASRSRTPINLYERETVVQPLDSSDFDRVVYNSSLATLVEYYAHWCGACKKVKPKIIELARQSVRWHESIIRVAAVNCGDAAFNEDLCQRHEIEIYPSLRLFAPKLASNRHGLTIQVDSVQVMLNRMVDFVQEKFHIPHLRDFESKKIESIFGSNKNAKYAILVVENKDSYLGKKLILDFLSKQHQVVIRRTTPESNPKLVGQLSASDSSSLPKVFVLNRVKNQPETFDLPYLKQLKPDLDTNDLERNVGEDARSKLDWMIDRLIETTSTSTGEDETVEKVENQDQEEVEESSSTETNDSESDPNLENILDKVYMQDLESGLHLIIRSDISHSRIITGHKFDALKEWLRILVKYFPGRDVVRNYLINLSERLNQMSEITGNDWKTIADERTDDAYLPNVVEWYHCRGSNPEFRGYPCSLWTLFHVLTVAQVEQEYNKSNPFDDFKIKEVIEGIQLFVKYFFTCKECSENFARETHDYASNLEKPNDAVIYLWKVHNKVNRRLANEKDNDQDPKFPKVLFPTKTQCPKCRVESPETSNDDNANKATWNLREVQNYLNKYYSRSNLVPIEENPIIESSIEEVEKVAETEEQATTTNKIISVLDNVFSMRNGGVKVQIYTFLDKLVVFFTTFCYFSIY